MNQSEKRQFLIRSLLKEHPEYRDLSIQAEPESQRQLLRGLMNIRAPRRMDAEFLKTQDEYLQAETAAKGITDIDDLTPVQPGLYLWQGDITTLKCDAIVNAANSGMTGCYIPNHRCIDNAIHTYAGVELRLACEELMEQQGYPEPTGQAKIPPAFNLPCRYVLHTVGPIIDGRVTKKDKELLASCYRSCLELAAEKGLCGVLLHFHGRVSFSQRTGGGDRGSDGQRISQKAKQCQEGDLQCFQGFGQNHLRKAAPSRWNG